MMNKPIWELSVAQIQRKYRLSRKKATEKRLAATLDALRTAPHLRDEIPWLDRYLKKVENQRNFDRFENKEKFSKGRMKCVEGRSTERIRKPRYWNEHAQNGWCDKAEWNFFKQQFTRICWANKDSGRPLPPVADPRTVQGWFKPCAIERAKSLIKKYTLIWNADHPNQQFPVNEYTKRDKMGRTPKQIWVF